MKLHLDIKKSETAHAHADSSDQGQKFENPGNHSSHKVIKENQMGFLQNFKIIKCVNLH